MMDAELTKRSAGGAGRTKGIKLISLVQKMETPLSWNKAQFGATQKHMDIETLSSHLKNEAPQEVFPSCGD